MLGPWKAVGRMQREWAEVDVRCCGTPAPRLIGFDADEPLSTVMLRPFDKGQVMGPLIEALAFLLPFGANRLSVALPGRSWSLNDPIPPVSDEVDLRQRVIAEMRVLEDGTVSGCLHPFAVDGTNLHFEEVVDLGPPEGEVAHALAVTMRNRGRLDVDAEDVIEQYARLGIRGHEIAVAPAGVARLERLVREADPRAERWQIRSAD